MERGLLDRLHDALINSAINKVSLKALLHCHAKVLRRRSWEDMFTVVEVKAGYAKQRYTINIFD